MKLARTEQLLADIARLEGSGAVFSCSTAGQCSKNCAHYDVTVACTLAAKTVTSEYAGAHVNASCKASETLANRVATAELTDVRWGLKR